MLFWVGLVVGAMLFVAYANGANDNFKGVATLFGSRTTDYKKALGWATATTFAGSVAAFFLATRLVKTFQGKGLIPPTLAESEPFLVAVILGAALTVFLASRIGMPISTTHSLTGALLGGGLIAVGSNLGFDTLWKSFLAPLLLSPLIAIGMAFLAYPLLRLAMTSLGLTKESCLCIGEERVPVVVTPEGHFMATGSKELRVIVGQEADCVQRFAGNVFGVNVQTLLDLGHYLSAGAVSFARGLNDTPKIVALCVAAGTLELGWATCLVALFMALGGLLESRRVAETVSKRITGMEPDQGFIANLVTSCLVIFASRWGLPVSTTHVSCGALFGIGVANGKAQWGVIWNILLAWVSTLPVAALLAGGTFMLLQQLT